MCYFQLVVLFVLANIMAKLTQMMLIYENQQLLDVLALTLLPVFVMEKQRNDIRKK